MYKITETGRERDVAQSVGPTRAPGSSHSAGGSMTVRANWGLLNHKVNQGVENNNGSMPKRSKLVNAVDNTCTVAQAVWLLFAWLRV